MANKQPQIKQQTYFIKGMHCPSCEILVEKKLLEQKNIEAVEASLNKNQVRIEYIGAKPDIRQLNKVFKKENYIFSNRPRNLKTSKTIFDKQKLQDTLIAISVSALLIFGFIGLTKSGLAALMNINTESAMPGFFVFGLMAGLSSCSALLGGIILSMSKQWGELYQDKNSLFQKFEPHILFNSGRLISYALFGFLLGTIGGVLQISLAFTSILTISVSILMIFLGLQMLGVKAFQRFRFTAPKFITKYIADETNFKNKWMPFLMGFFTFLLPCGFTIAVQGIILTSGNALAGSLAMFLFALGTMPALLLISFSSVKFYQKKHLANRFFKVAGILILFFAIYNINAQLNVLGFKSLNDINFNFWATAQETDLPKIINGKQILEMDALAYDYKPNRLKVRAGIPVQWRITDKGTSGCTNAIISNGLFDGEIKLTRGTTAIKEFTPKEPGIYKFSCWMGMVSGTIQVVDDVNNDLGQNQIIDSGATSSCGSSCTGGCGGGCRNPNCEYAQ